jgi:hypothetical protein
LTVVLAAPAFSADTYTFDPSDEVRVNVPVEAYKD